jgi:hypothetical protein
MLVSQPQSKCDHLYDVLASVDLGKHAIAFFKDDCPARVANNAPKRLKKTSRISLSTFYCNTSRAIVFEKRYNANAQ